MKERCRNIEAALKKAAAERDHCSEAIKHVQDFHHEVRQTVEEHAAETAAKKPDLRLLSVKLQPIDHVLARRRLEARAGNPSEERRRRLRISAPARCTPGVQSAWESPTPRPISRATETATPRPTTRGALTSRPASRATAAGVRALCNTPFRATGNSTPRTARFEGAPLVVAHPSQPPPALGATAALALIESNVASPDTQPLEAAAVEEAAASARLDATNGFIVGEGSRAGAMQMRLRALEVKAHQNAVHLDLHREHVDEVQGFRAHLEKLKAKLS